MSNAGPSRRYDGKKSHEIRPLQIEIGELDRADGSGRFGFGSTAALASCSGPLEVRINKELPTKATLEISHRPLEGVGATPSRALVNTLESIFPSALSLTSLPRSLIQIIVQSLSSSSSPSSSSSSRYDSVPTVYIDTDPDTITEKNAWPQQTPTLPTQEEGSSPLASYTFSSRAASINASTLSILDSGSIPMISLPIAISIADLGPQKGLVVDPTNEEEGNAVARFGFAWSFGKHTTLTNGEEDNQMDVEDEGGVEHEQEMELVWVESEGKFNKEKFSDALELSKIACKQILSEIREKLGERLEKRRLIQ